MKLAKDGKPFDIDNVGKLLADEAEVILYVWPSNKRRRLAFKVGEKIAMKAGNLILSMETVCSGFHCCDLFHGRKIGQAVKDQQTITIGWLIGMEYEGPIEVVIKLIENLTENK